MRIPPVTTCHYLLTARVLGALLIEVVLEDVHPCNLLWQGEHQGLSARVSKADGPVEVALRITDYWGNEVVNAVRTVNPVADDGRIRWDLATLGNGYCACTRKVWTPWFPT